MSSVIRVSRLSLPGVLSVHSDNSEWTKKAKEILERTGAQDIASTGETKGDTENTDRPMARHSSM